MPQVQEEKIIPVDRETMIEFLATGHCVVQLQKGGVGRIGSVVQVSDDRIMSSAKIYKRYRDPHERNPHIVLIGTQ